jgi:hypothetical protein
MADAMADADDVAFVIAFIICVELSKEPEYRCEYCDKVYKQEARYVTHVKGCVEKDTLRVAAVPVSVPPPPPPPPPKVCIEKDTPRVAPAPAMLDNTTVMELLRQNGDMLELLRKQQETIQMLVARSLS